MFSQKVKSRVAKSEVFSFYGEEETLDFVRSLALPIRGVPALAVQKGNE